MSESDVIREILLVAPKYNSRLFRNNVGVAFQPNGQVIRYGLFKGSSDLIGWTTVRNKAIFTAIEVKFGRTKTTEEQRTFLNALRISGGFAAVVRSLDDYTKAMEQLDDDTVP